MGTFLIYLSLLSRWPLKKSGMSPFLVLVMSLVATPNDVLADLRAQLNELATMYGFEIQGLGLVGNESARVVSGDVRQQLDRLLGGYNYVVVDDEQGDIGKVIILAVGEAGVLPEVGISNINILSPPGTHVIPARREGAHQVVDAVVVGPGQAPVAVSLMVDTGASTVVLPASMIALLGFDDEELRDGWTQTANGRVLAKIGTLDSVDVGTAVVEGVDVTFLDDRRLGGSKLLGMSFLQHFSLTIDDANSRIILSAE
jgi:aspartyl protease family protein